MHEAQQGDACGFYRYELEALTQVAESHDGRQQYRERQGQWDGGDRDVSGELKDAQQVKPLPHEVVNIFPEELHHQHKKCHKKCGDERPYESLQDEFVEFLEQGRNRRFECDIFA